MTVPKSVWCESDEHYCYEQNVTFNHWLDEKGEEAEKVIERYGFVNIAVPSKALFGGDRSAYEQELTFYRAARMNIALGADVFVDLWLKKNKAHFDQLVTHLKGQSVIPFVGAGVSCSSGYPGWSNHLRIHALAAGVSNPEDLLSKGNYEKVIEEIIAINGIAMFVQNIKDDFLKDPSSLEWQAAILRLCKHVVVTTNYDQCIEKAMVRDESCYVEPIFAAEADNQTLIAACSNRRRALLKLHGNISSPANCILSQEQYDRSYGRDAIDMSLPLPRKLRRLFEYSSLLFLGCGLNEDRTMRVFESVIEENSDLPQHFAIVEAPIELDQLPKRNKFLADHGITAIWYPAGEHARVFDILNLLSEEVAD
ncbi:SIR2 family protein [bacterium M00.F.Ca.ET.227.01.1.1]|nr:SIR2 family protein [bacterium M00.F.Ca.ET.227.01.1.1]TGU38899.1 SIR2 family protein [bacterium M00.F.Ca.ET.156.01.1.1]